MSKLSRRTALVALFAVLAVAGTAQAAGKAVGLDKAFPYLENYLRIPAAERSRFVVAYYLMRGGKPATGLKAWIVQGALQTPVPIGADGRVQRLPSLQQLQAKAKLSLDAPADSKFQLSLQIEPLVRPAAEVDAQQLVLAVLQADAGVHKAAGLLGFAAPKLTRVYFKGAVGSEAVWADGRRVKLGVLKGLPYFDLPTQKGAKLIRFTRPPVQMEIGPAG
jgi:hypothetical protein